MLFPIKRHEIKYINKLTFTHDNVIKWKHFPRYWPFVRGIHRSPVNSPHKRQWRGALMLSLIWVWINGWVNNREAGDLRRQRADYDVTILQRCFTDTSAILYLLVYQVGVYMMTSSKGNIFCDTGRLCGEFTGHRWIPRTKANDAELWCFLWSAPWINGWVNNHEAGDLRRLRAHYDVIVMHNIWRALHMSFRDVVNSWMVCPICSLSFVRN